VSRATRPIAIVMAAATIVASVVAAVVIALAAGRGIPDVPSPWEGLPLVVGVGVPACVGLVLLLRRPDTRVAWILLAGALSVALVMAAMAVGYMALELNPRSATGAWLLLFSQEWVVLFLWPLALAYLFPDGRLPSPRWRVPAALTLASCAGAMFLLLLVDPTLKGPRGEVRNPLVGGAVLEFLLPVFWVCWFGLLLSLFGGALALRARYRAGSHERRRQVLWLAYGALLAPLWLGGASLARRLLGEFETPDLLVLMLVYVWLAVAVVVAVTRHGLYEIDRLFNRTLVYVVLTALLAGTYALVALVAGQLAGGSVFAASAGTLAAALAFRPLRDRLQAVVDRRFARRRVDAVRLLRDFLDDVRDGRSEPEDVGAALRLALDDPAPRWSSACPRPAPTRIARATSLTRCPTMVVPVPRSDMTSARSACCSMTRLSPSGPMCCARCWTPRRWRWSSAACGSSCACSSRRSSPRARGSPRPVTRSGGGSSAICTMARSSGS
jgi:hypothetical protein